MGAALPICEKAATLETPEFPAAYLLLLCKPEIIYSAYERFLHPIRNRQIVFDTMEKVRS
jgi:hypothetical protein